MLITTNTSEYNLNAMNASEYPDRDLNINNKPIIIKQKFLKILSIKLLLLSLIKNHAQY